MIQFISKTFLFIIISFILLFLIFAFGDKGLKKERLGSVSKGIKTDILILGTSRAYRHFDTQVLEKSTGKEFFNLGLDASGFQTQKELLKYFIKYNGYPKEIIWEYNFGFLNKERNIYDFELLLPIADEYNIFHLLNKFKIISKWLYPIKTFRYIGHTEVILRGVKNQIRPKEFLDYKIQNLKWNKESFESIYLNGNFRYEKEISQGSLSSYLEIIDDLKKNNVKITMVFTPMYSGVFLVNDEKYDLLNYYDSLFSNNYVRDLNFLFSTISDDTLNFYNALHMNRNGVDKFSKEFLNAF
ncbi:hypothetical protein E4S40_00940 [Algoriphagus kandeliae]|uniref:DUF1574 domain-containing protein n=1 Tax=Algoriphagus kandeliae TaxID=2562278 RepID=A0A4Y9R190_9BACT|nr:hypothetical protein [Algoriphagus kandeliae]TFV97253.1 hypothetical protein E4S40_00940 [Algoriphagus kandeliae]